uniref:Uncharacterized protein n=1 Tax=Arundo donax TaxID=35708 RepID=A0A0A9H325_ARUDO
MTFSLGSKPKQHTREKNVRKRRHQKLLKNI